MTTRTISVVATLRTARANAFGQRKTMMSEAWEDYAACRNHPELDADAWSGVVQGSPRDEGAEALIVCRQVCPVRRQCREHFQGISMVAGGGWFNGHGEFDDADGLLDIYQAAAYIGVSPRRVQTWLNRKIFSVAPDRKKSWFKLADVRQLAMKYGPKHGSEAARRLHVIRGEGLCPLCRLLTDESADSHDLVAVGG
jgi:transcription factor WhiB